MGSLYTYLLSSKWGVRKKSQGGIWRKSAKLIFSNFTLKMHQTKHDWNIPACFKCQLHTTHSCYKKGSHMYRKLLDRGLKWDVLVLCRFSTFLSIVQNVWMFFFCTFLRIEKRKAGKTYYILYKLSVDVFYRWMDGLIDWFIDRCLDRQKDKFKERYIYL